MSALQSPSGHLQPVTWENDPRNCNRDSLPERERASHIRKKRIEKCGNAIARESPLKSNNAKADRVTDCGTWRLAVDVGEVDSREQHSASAGDVGGIGSVGEGEGGSSGATSMV